MPITTLDERLTLIAGTGIAVTVVVLFHQVNGAACLPPGSCMAEMTPPVEFSVVREFTMYHDGIPSPSCAHCVSLEML